MTVLQEHLSPVLRSYRFRLQWDADAQACFERCWHVQRAVYNRTVAAVEAPGGPGASAADDCASPRERMNRDDQRKYGSGSPRPDKMRHTPKRKTMMDASQTAAARKNPAVEASEIPHAVAELAQRMLAKVQEADAIVLFGSRARGDADEQSDWDLIVRSRALLPHNLLVLEGFTPEDGWVGGCGTVQSVSLSDYEAAHHAGEDNSLAVAWSREGTVIAGADALIGEARCKRLNMNERKIEELTRAALRKIRTAWASISEAHEENTTADDVLEIAPEVVNACEMVAKLNTYSHGILGAKTHNLHSLHNQLLDEAGGNKAVAEDAKAIASMNGATATTRLTLYGRSDLDEKTRAQVEEDMRWERTAQRWQTLLALHVRTLERLQQQDGPAATAASDAIRKCRTAGQRMMRDDADREILKKIPSEARRATRLWIRQIKELETTHVVPTLDALHRAENVKLTAQRRKARAALRDGDLARALALTQHWIPRNLPPSGGRERLLGACRHWRDRREANLDEIEALMRRERRNAIDAIARSARALCAELKKAARESAEQAERPSVESVLKAVDAKQPHSTPSLDARDVEIIVEGVASAARRNQLAALDTARIVHTVVIDRTRRERQAAVSMGDAGRGRTGRAE